MVFDRAKEAKKFHISRSIDAGRAQDDEFAAAVRLDFFLGGKFALPIHGDGMGSICFAGGCAGYGGARCGKAGNMNESFNLRLLSVYGIEEIACAALVD